MRVTRYLWISNLPARATEQDIRDVLQSHGKIQSIRIHTDKDVNGAVVAFADTKSASRAMDSAVRMNKVNLALQYCESSGTPSSQSQDNLTTSQESTKQSHSSTELHENNSIIDLSEMGNNNQELFKRSNSQTCLLYPNDTRISNGMESSGEESMTRHSGDLRGLQIRQLPLRSSDANLREGLFHEYKKHGKITSVLIRGHGEDRHCIITFKRGEDAERALEVSRSKVFFGRPISVLLHEGLDSEDPDLCPPEHALDEYHPKATKTLFVGNLISNTITQDELRQIFRVYGEIIEIDIKIQVNQPGTSYAFVQYSDIRSVVRALNDQDVIRVGGKSVKLGFGKSQPTNVVWLDNLAPSVSENFLTRQFGRYGHLTHVVLDRKSLRALLYFDTVEMAQRALNETRNRALIGRKVQLDYAGYECQVAFMRRFAQHDSFGQVYEDYRERLKELLALWPSYGSVVPVLDRHRLFADSKRDGSIAPLDSELPCGRRRLNKYGVNEHISNLESLKSKRDSMESNSKGSCTSKSRVANRGGHIERTSSVEGSLSPSTRVRSRSKDSRKPLHSSSSKTVDSNIYQDSFTKHPRRHTSLNFSPYSESSPHVPLSGQTTVGPNTKCARASHASSIRSSSKRVGLYLEETDDVSSGPLSPDPECSDESSPLIRHKYNSRSPQRMELSRFRDGDVDRRTKSSVHAADTKHCRLHRYETPTHHAPDTRQFPPKVLSSANSTPHQDQCKPKNHCADRSRIATSCQSSVLSVNDASRMPNITCDRVDDTHARKYSQSGASLSRHGHPAKSMEHKGDSGRFMDIYEDVISATTPPADIIPTDLFRQNSSERIKHNYYASKNSDNSSESHDTLTKLELERAKLLRELSLLNNEVVGGIKPKLTNSTSKRQRESSSDREMYPKKLKCLNDRRKEASSCDQSFSPLHDNEQNQSTPASSRETLAYRSEYSESVKPLIDITGLRSSNGCMSSSSEPGDIFSPFITERLSSPVSAISVDNQSTLTSVSVSKEYAPGLLSSMCSTALTPLSVNISCSTATSQQLVVPPPPASPLMRLTSPEHMDKKNPVMVNPPVSPSASVNGGTTTCSAVHGAAPLSGTGAILTVSRDPRLAVHHTQILSDLPPPPPPPPPESLKLPLWVNTSRLPDNDPILSPDRINTISPSFTHWRHTAVNGSIAEPDIEHINVSQDNNCSLDERIRLLDARLMKSEKARPTVDYSKFRIRRKQESVCTTAETSSTVASPLNSMVTSSTTVISATPSSPVIGISSSFTSSLTQRCCTAELTPVSSPVLAPLPSTVQSMGLPSPVLITRHSDTSEFVKSMLSSSKPSPATPSDVIGHTCGEPTPITNSRRPASRFLSSAVSNSDGQNMLDTDAEVIPVSTGQVSTSVSNTRHLFSSLASRFFPSVSTSTSTSSQVVGVATRMPVVQPSAEKDNCVKLTHSANAPRTTPSVKSILKRDSLVSPGTCTPITFAASSTHFSDAINAVQTTCPKSPVPLLMKMKDGDRLNDPLSKTPKSTTSKTITQQPTVTTSVRTTTAKRYAVSTASSAAKSLKPISTSDSNRSTMKTQKTDTPRHTLDDTVFRSSFDQCLSVKPEKPKKLRKDSSSSLSQKSRLIKPNQSTQSTVTHDRELNPKTDLHRVNKKRALFTEQQKTTLTAKAIEKTKTHIPGKDKIKALLTKCSDDPKQAGVPGKCEHRKLTKSQLSGSSVASKGTKKGKLIRRDISDSDLSDWEPSANTSNKEMNNLEVDLSLCPGYESMYDKIKRRASKNTGKKDVGDKDDAIKRLINAREKDVRSISKKKPLNRSDADSDTDQCLSDNSSVDTGKQSAKKCNRILKAALFEDHTVAPCKRKSKLKSSMHISDIKGVSKERKKRLAENFEERHSQNDGTFKKHRKFSYITEVESVPADKAGRGLSKQERSTNTKRAAGRTRRLPTTSQASKTSTVLSPLKSNLKLSNDLSSSRTKVNLKEERHGTVRRVFTSPDSDSPYESDLENRSKQSYHDGVHAIDKSATIKSLPRSPGSPSSLSSTPQFSQSCSPDDLDADAAIRHTFGAFAAPFNSTPSKRNELASHATKMNSSPKIDASNTPHTSRSTPPTLSMLDSGSSVSQSLKASDNVGCEWNMFTSIIKQSTPKKEPIQLDTSPSVSFNPDAVLVDQELNDSKAPSDFDDLPSLDKHDEDESGKPDGNSILLNETDSLMHNGNNVVSMNDDDLPPPVVSAIDLSPHHLSYSDCAPGATSGVISDVIEEVVYDSLELHVPVADQSLLSTTTAPFTQPTSSPVSASSSDVKTEHVLEELVHPTVVEYPVQMVQSQLPLSSSVHLDIKQMPVDSVSTAPPLPVSINSTVGSILTPLTLMKTAPSVTDPSDALPSSTVPNFSIKSPKLTILPQCSPQSTSLCNQRHVTLILPATPVAINGSVSHTPTPTVFASPKLVLATPMSDLRETSTIQAPMSSITTAGLTGGQTIKGSTTNLLIPVSSACSTILKIPEFVDAVSSTAGVFTVSVASPIGQAAVVTTQAPTTNVAFDPSDLTSYVQRVIERVKQEKDEEVSTQREKIKRTKKVLPVPLQVTPAVSINAASNSPVGAFTSPITPLPVIPGVNVCPRPHVTNTQPGVTDHSVSLLKVENVPISQQIIGETIHSEYKTTTSDSLLCMTRSDPKSVEPIHVIPEGIKDPSKLSEPFCEPGVEDPVIDVERPDNTNETVRDTVDEVINAVLSGQFDEAEYLRRLRKGIFDLCAPSCRPTISSPNLGLPTIPTEESCYQKGITEHNIRIGDQPTSSSNLCISESVSVPSATVSTTPIECQPQRVFTPMHVLTFVATGAPSTGCPPLSATSAISPSLSSPSLNTRPPAIGARAASPAPATLGASQCPNNLPNICDPCPSRIHPNPQYASSRPIQTELPSSDLTSTSSHLEKFAPINIPLTNYIYSLLAQQKQIPTVTNPPSVSSNDTSGSTTTVTSAFELHNGSPLITSFKSFPLPSVVSCTTSNNSEAADYYAAAATMAAMAAMASPSAGFGESPPSAIATTGLSYPTNLKKDTSSDVTCLNSSQQQTPFWFDQTLTVPDYPLAWQGRLALKNEEVHVQMHFLRGTQDLLKSCMTVISDSQQLSAAAAASSMMTTSLIATVPSTSAQPLKIAQRMRLEESQLEGVQRKLRQASDFCMCVTLATAPPLTPAASLQSVQMHMNRILCDGFIKYMVDKCAAGIINVCHPINQQNLFVIHIFPPCDFSRRQLELSAPGLAHQLNQQRTPHLLVIITTV